MRDIKFRAWNKKKEIMCYDNEDESEDYWDGIESSKINLINYHLSTNPYGEGLENDALRARYEVMQYTGMQDMNCQDIYEGDIVRRNFEVGRVTYDEVSLGADGYEIIDAGHFIGVVSYRPSAGFILNQCRKYNEENELVSKRSGVKVHPQYAEVIGNVYENPELLEDTK